jgi:hypothetical protein
MAELDESHEDGYSGDVSLHIAERDVTLRATLRGYFEPVDGRYHWYGRLVADAGLAELVGTGKAAARVTTDHGSAECVVSDIDPWGRLRISGISTPPFPIARSLDDVERRELPSPTTA